MTDQIPEILLADDSPTDVMLTVEALKFHNVLNPVHVAEDGIKAMEYLRRQGRHAGARLPGLIILDLNMPRKGGREVLTEIKNDPELRAIPVVVLTMSKAEEDVARAYGLHANCYITKPVDFEKFTDVVRAINDYWFGVVTLPPGRK